MLFNIINRYLLVHLLVYSVSRFLIPTNCTLFRRLEMTLTVKVVDKAKPKEKPYKLTDARGLYVQVMPNGSKYWRLAYRFLNRQKTLALGVYPDLSLSEARKLREEAKSQLANNIDQIGRAHV